MVTGWSKIVPKRRIELYLSARRQDEQTMMLRCKSMFPCRFFVVVGFDAFYWSFLLSLFFSHLPSLDINHRSDRSSLLVLQICVLFWQVC